MKFGIVYSKNTGRIRSIIVPENEKEQHMIVFSKEWFKKHNKTLCWFANAPIIKYWFRWLLRIQKDIPWNEKIEEITPSSFTYGKKLLLTDKGLRWQQTTDFRIHEKFGKRLYYGLKPLWYLLHFWDWSTAVQPKLNLGFDTLTVYPDAGAGNTTVDGSVTMSNPLSDSSKSWSLIRNGAGSAANATGSLIGMTIYSHNSTWRWNYIERCIFTVDTSELTADATITDAMFSCRGASKSDDLGISPNIDVYTSAPADDNDLVAGDFDSLGTTSMTGSPISYSSWVTQSWNDFTFNATGRGNISKTGISRFGLRNANYDVNNVEPAWSNQLSSTILLYSSDWQGGTTYDPKLVVTYTAPSGPTHLKTINSIAKANVKTFNGISITKIKKINSVD